jgi:hypothetical protein
MVGDIDLLFKKDEVNLAYKTLKKNNYKENGGSSEMIPNHRHFRRLVNKKNIAALEIHKEILRDTYSKQFNYNSLESNLKLEQGFWVPNFKHQLVLTILSKQINDNGYQLKAVYLRSLYDVFLFSKKTNSLNAIQDFPYFFFQTNSFLALTSVVLNHPISIKYEDNKTVKNYVNSSLNNLKSKKRLIRCQIFLKHRIPVFLKAFYKKDYRRFLLSRIKARPNA